MDIKLLFQILTPLSVGGSVIGLFGDFGDGWAEVGETIEDVKLTGNPFYVEVRNEQAFGKTNGKIGTFWLNGKAGQVHADKYYVAAKDFDKDVMGWSKGSSPLLVTGIGYRNKEGHKGLSYVTSNGRRTYWSLREDSSSGRDPKNQKVTVRLDRVPITGSGKETKVMQDVCTVRLGVQRTGRKGGAGVYVDGYLMFARGRIKIQEGIGKEQNWRSGQAQEQYVKGSGCGWLTRIFTGEAWLHGIKTKHRENEVPVGAWALGGSGGIYEVGRENGYAQVWYLVGAVITTNERSWRNGEKGGGELWEAWRKKIGVARVDSLWAIKLWEQKGHSDKYTRPFNGGGYVRYVRKDDNLMDLSVYGNEKLNTFEITAKQGQ